MLAPYIKTVLLVCLFLAPALAGKRDKGKKGYSEEDNIRVIQIPVHHPPPQRHMYMPHPMPYPVHMPRRPQKQIVEKIYIPIVKTVKVPVIIREKVHYVHTSHQEAPKMHHSYSPPKQNSYSIQQSMNSYSKPHKKVTYSTSYGPPSISHSQSMSSYSKLPSKDTPYTYNPSGNKHLRRRTVAINNWENNYSLYNRLFGTTYS